MARTSRAASDPSTFLVMYVALRKTKVINDSVVLPRPKLTQDVLLIGTEEECLQKIDEIVLKPENISDDIVEVELSVTKYAGQISYTSKSITRNNGKRNPRGIAGNASEPNH